jgi:hypothetical protein
MFELMFEAFESKANADARMVSFNKDFDMSQFDDQLISVVIQDVGGDDVDRSSMTDLDQLSDGTYRFYFG